MEVSCVMSATIGSIAVRHCPPEVLRTPEGDRKGHPALWISLEAIHEPPERAAMTKTAEYEIVRHLTAQREQVYAAWTRPERFARWFGPRIFTTPADRVVLDVRPGGAW